MDNKPNLVAEVHTDKNGKRTTRHIRSTPNQAAGSFKLPAPVLSHATPGEPAQPRMKARPKQRAQVPFKYKATFYRADEELISKEHNRSDNATYEFSASAVEAYAVLSTVQNIGSAMAMLAAGVRTVEDAQQFLMDHGAEHLIVDRSSITNEALEKNLSPTDYFTQAGRMKLDKAVNLVDAILYMSSSLNAGANGLAREDIIKGTISYGDIQALGLTKLKSKERLYTLRPLLRRVQLGEESIENVKVLLDRVIEEDIPGGDLRSIVEVVKQRGFQAVNQLSKLQPLADAYYIHHVPSDKTAAKYGDTAMDRTIYSAQLKSGAGEYSYNVASFTYQEYWDAGIPVETGIKALSRGLGFTAAQAMHAEGINENLAEGWL